MVELKICNNNLQNGTQQIIDRLKNEEREADINIIIEPCVGMCVDCSVGPFVLYNEEFLQGESVDILYDKIQQKLKREKGGILD